MATVLVGAYFTTRWTATRMGNVQNYGLSSQKLALVSRLPLGREQQLLVVKVGERHVVLGCTSTQISFITELTQAESEEFVKDSVVNPMEMPNFHQVIQNLKQKGKKNNDSTKD